jgi:hypothetical protein
MSVYESSCSSLARTLARVAHTEVVQAMDQACALQAGERTARVGAELACELIDRPGPVRLVACQSAQQAALGLRQGARPG